MSNTEYKLAIKIAGMVEQSLNEACNLTKKQLRAVAKEAAASSKASVSFSDAMGQAGSGINSLWDGATQAVKTTAEALLAAGAAAGVVGGVVIHVGSDFESAFAGVKKTVDATEQQLADLEEGLRDMAKNMPMTAVELSGIAEAAGQLGIHTENIEDFTKTMADLSVATNLSTDEGASQLAKFANITGMAQDKFENLGSAIVDLGNHMATTEADITEMGMRLAGAGTQVGMSEADIMGFAAALSSVGIEAEAGGSAMSKMMVNMQLAVETGADAWGPLEESLAKTGHTTAQAEAAVAAGGKALTSFAAAAGWNAKQLKASVKEAQDAAGSLQDFADVADMTSEEFSAAFKDNAAKALGAFISGLNDTERLGQSAIVTLDAMDIKEVRLRDTLLRAANASELFNDAIDMSNIAFEENTALMKEADQRYQTFESRLDMVKNRVTDMGITLYQDFRDPLSDCLDVALDFTASNLFDASNIERMAKSFKKSIPTMIRHIENAKDAFVDFAHPVFEIGDWMIENPDVIAGTLAGIGTTIASLKLVQTVTNVAGAIKTLTLAMASNPITAAIGLAALAGGAIVGIATKVKIANKELKKQNLASHFGDLSLSIGELKKAANQIIDNGSLSKLSTVMDGFTKVKNIANDINDAQNAINKLNWKVGMEFDLSEADMDEYGAQISSYIENSIELAEQQQYTMNLNLQLLTDDDNTGHRIINHFNSFYDNMNQELRDYGEELGRVYAEGMKDGVLSLDEVEAIQELQQKMADITAKLSSSQFEAKLETIGVKYGGGALDAESFQNLQAELQEQVEEASANLQDSLVMNIAGAKLQFEEGAIDQQQYDEMIAEFKENYLEQIGEIQLKATSFQTDALYQQYADEIDEMLPQLNQFISKRMEEYFDNAQIGGNANMSFTAFLTGFDSGLSQDTKDALGELWDSLEPDLARLESVRTQYQEAGNAIPQELVDAISDTSALGIISGSQDALWSYIGTSAMTNEEYKKTIEKMQEIGYVVPETIASGLEANITAIEDSIDILYQQTLTQLNNSFRNFDIVSNVNVKFNSAGASVPAKAPKAVAHARGGIFDTPHWGVFAEEGAEAFIPLNKSSQSVSIWRQAGEMLGVLGENNSSNLGNVSIENSGSREAEATIIYSPTYQIYNTTEETIRNATSDDYERFERFMRQHEKSKRLSFI